MIIALVILGLFIYSCVGVFTAGAIADVCRDGWVVIIWGVFWPVFWIIILFELIYKFLFEKGRRL